MLKECSLGDGLERFNDGTIDSGQDMGHVAQAYIADRLNFCGKSSYDAKESVRVEDLNCLRKRPQRSSATAELPLDVLKFTRFLECPKGPEHWIEQKHQDKQAVLVVIQIAVACFVTLAAVLVKLLKHGQEQLKVFQTLNVRLLTRFGRFLGHQYDPAKLTVRSNW